MSKDILDGKWHADGYERGAYWARRWNDIEQKFEIQGFEVRITNREDPIMVLSEKEFAEECKQVKSKRAKWMREQNKGVSVVELLAKAIKREAEANPDQDSPEPYRAAGDRLVDQALALID